MRLPPVVLRPMSFLTWERHQFLRSYFPVQELSISDEVLFILGSVSPMEPALEPLVPFLSRDVVISVVGKQPDLQLAFRFFIWAMQRSRFRGFYADNLIVDMLWRNNSFDLYWQTLEEARKSGVPLVAHVFTVLISGYAKMGLAAKAVETFEKMRVFHCRPDVNTFNRIMHVMVQKGILLLVLSIYNQMIKVNCNPNHVTFGILIEGLCTDNKAEKALQLFDEMTRKGISPNKFIYTSVISGLCRANTVDNAYRLFLKMKQSGCSPDVVTYNALFSGFCKVGRLDEAFALLQSFEKEGFELDMYGYGSFLDGFVRAKRYEDAYKWFSRALEIGVKPNAIFYSIMVRGLSEAGRINDAIKLLDEMTERRFVPDSYCYSAIIKGLCDLGLWDEAKSLLLEISRDGSFPSAHVYTILISGLCKRGLLKSASQIFDEMEKRGCFPSVVTYNALINGLCNVRQLDRANLLFYKMEIGRSPSLFLRLSHKTNHGFDSSSLQNLVEHLCESGQISEAYKLLMQLADCRTMPDIYTYNILIRGLCKAGNINGALKLFQELQIKGLSPDSVTYVTLIGGLQKANRGQESLTLFNQMEKNGCAPSLPVYRLLMTWYNRRKKVSFTFILWLKYLRRYCHREEKVLKAIEKSLHNGDIEMAVRSLLEMDFKLNDFNLSAYTIFIIGLCEARKLEVALKIFYILDEYEVTVSAPCCVKLINCLCRGQKLDHAIDIFRYTLEKGFKVKIKVRNFLLRSILRSKRKSAYVFDLLHIMKSHAE